MLDKLTFEFIISLIASFNGGFLLARYLYGKGILKYAS